MTPASSDHRGAAEAPLRDRIEVRGLRVDAVHGVGEQERSSPQPLELDLDLYLPLSPAASTDELRDTDDYAAVVSTAVSVLLGPPRRLLETLAEEVAQAVLADGRVDMVTVAVRKLRPPVEHQLVSAGVRVTRRRP